MFSVTGKSGEILILLPTDVDEDKHDLNDLRGLKTETIWSHMGEVKRVEHCTASALLKIHLKLHHRKLLK